MEEEFSKIVIDLLIMLFWLWGLMTMTIGLLRIHGVILGVRKDLLLWLQEILVALLLMHIELFDFDI